MDPRELLETILRINGAAMVQTGNFYRIVPLVDLAHCRLKPESWKKTFLRMSAHAEPRFLKYADVEELAKLVVEFLGADGKAGQSQRKLLFVLDSRRNMRRLMELVAMFDSDCSSPSSE